MSNNIPKSPDHAEVIKPARELCRLHDRDARRKLLIALWWAIMLLGASAALSQVTGSVLTRLMSTTFAYLLGTALHLAIGLAIHLLVGGAVQGDRKDKAVGAVFLAIGLAALVYVFVVRALIIVEEGHSKVFAWAISAFLLLLESVIPALLGYVLAKAWLERKQAAEEARFYCDLKQLIETSAQPAKRWSDAEYRLAYKIAENQGSLPKASPEGIEKINAENERIRRRLHTLREWNPTMEFQPTRSDTHTDVLALALFGSDGQGDPSTLAKSMPPVHVHQTDKRDDAIFKG